MTDQDATTIETGRTRLPLWLESLVALIGMALLAGPAVATLWYR